MSSRRLARTTAVSDDARMSPGTDHLRKRHTSQGPSRRRLDAKLPPELADLTDAELDNRNARVWAVVLADCQRAAGLEPDAFPNLRSIGTRRAAGRGGGRSCTHALAMRAALVIANEQYGIPAARLAPLIERSPSDTARYIRDARRHEVEAIRAVWTSRGGPAHVEASAETRQLDVPAHVYEQISREARRCGASLGAVVARLVGTLSQ